MARNYPQFSLKIAPDYLDKLKYIANENGRVKEYEKTYGEIEKEDIECFFKLLK